MITWKTKRERELEELVAAYQAQIKVLTDTQGSNINPAQFVNVPIPQESDMPEYWRKLAALLDDNFYLFYLTQLRRTIVDQFEVNGNDKAEYFRGKLAVIGDIINDSRKARIQMLKPRGENAL